MQLSRALAAIAVFAVLAAPPAAADEPPAAWLAGDCHAHMRPIDDDGHVSITLDRTIAVAKKAHAPEMLVVPVPAPQEASS